MNSLTRLQQKMGFSIRSNCHLLQKTLGRAAQRLAPVQHISNEESKAENQSHEDGEVKETCPSGGKACELCTKR